MKLGCPCGHTISDITDEIPYKAHLVPDEDTYAPDEAFAEEIARLVEARGRGPDDERTFLIDYGVKYGMDRAHAEAWVDRLQDRSTLAKVISYLVPSFIGYYDREMFECEACGRLLVEVWREGSTDPSDMYFVTYQPEADRRGVLRSRWHFGRNPMFRQTESSGAEG